MIVIKKNVIKTECKKVKKESVGIINDETPTTTVVKEGETIENGGNNENDELI